RLLKLLSAFCGNHYTSIRKYFDASTFAKLQSNSTSGTVSIVNFFNYVMRKVWFQESRIALSLYDSDGQGYLTEDELEAYLSELIPTLTKLGNLDPKFYPFYLCIVVRKFFFFLDSHHTQRIKIVDILESGFLEDLLELRNENLQKTREETNWFSYDNALRFYSCYISLDENQNGMLSKDEFRKFGNGCFSRLFVDRIFEELLTYNGEIDFKVFIDLILMMENKKEPQSLNLYFHLLDINHEYFIDDFVLKVFLKSLEEKLLEQGHDPLNMETVAVEVCDMIKPQNTRKITLKDLISSGQGDVVVTILTDCNGFWCYENRELLFLDSQEEADV
ncbi:serine/threonine-protein phosphatase 2A regulatory subunit B'' subunit gamma-like isoform X1, partial [Leptotrombidium deliense]